MSAPVARLDLAPPAVAVPRRLCRLHRTTRPGETVALAVAPPLAAMFGRRHVPDLDLLLTGAGFDVRADGAIVRARTLPDTVAPNMALLVCGLNPSLTAADAGVGFAGATNRFWPALIAAGVALADQRDPDVLLDGAGIGMTDLVKRATPRASELSAEEYRAGHRRLDALCRWLRPAVVCHVGLAGWRAAVDRRATAGWSETTLGGRPVYVMPSTSGLNASTSAAALADHLRTVLAPASRG